MENTFNVKIIKTALQELALEFGIKEIEKEFYKIDLEEISELCDEKIIDFDELAKKYCFDLNCDRYKSVDGILISEKENSIYFIEVKSFKKYNIYSPTNNIVENFTEFINGELYGKTKNSKTTHPFDSKILDTYFILFGILSKKSCYEGISLLIKTQDNIKRPINFYWYIPLDEEEFNKFSLASANIIKIFEESMKRRFRTLEKFRIIGNVGIKQILAEA